MKTYDSDLPIIEEFVQLNGRPLLRSTAAMDGSRLASQQGRSNYCSSSGWQ